MGKIENIKNDIFIKLSILEHGIGILYAQSINNIMMDRKYERLHYYFKLNYNYLSWWQWQRLFVILQGNYSGVSCNIIVGIERRRCCVNIIIKNTIISQVGNDEDYEWIFKWVVLEYFGTF